jgi:hypothetical protein
LNSKELHRVNFNIPAKRKITFKCNNKIQWGYYDYHHQMNIVCNDILITRSSIRNTFRYTDGNIIVWKPSLVVEDTQEILPLKLNRKELASNALPFEKELLMDVSKDFVAYLLTYPISLNDIKHAHNSYFSYFHHKILLMYMKNGFGLASDYFINRVNEYRFFKINTTTNSITNLRWFFLNYITDNDVYIPYCDDNDFLEKTFLSDMNIHSKNSGRILNQLFEKYIGNNVIIPYDIEERKKLYPLAFEELKDYMKDYEK